MQDPLAIKEGDPATYPLVSSHKSWGTTPAYKPLLERQWWFERGSEKAEVVCAGYSGLWNVYSQPLHKLNFLTWTLFKKFSLSCQPFEIFATQNLLISAYVLVGQKKFLNNAFLYFLRKYIDDRFSDFFFKLQNTHKFLFHMNCDLLILKCLAIWNISFRYS